MIIGKQIFHYSTIDSTNTEAKRLIASGQAAEGAVIIADAQTTGRGKPGSSWFSPPDLGLYLSAAVKPYKNQADLTNLTSVAAAAVADLIKDLTRLEAAIKLSNDILLSGKKVCGILCEHLTSGFVVIGIGLNVNHLSTSFPAELAGQATSLQIETGDVFDLTAVRQKILEQLNRHYLAYLREIC
ncbi:biotin--[acetyl-CoA-carboxylase] ligase [Candidatus Saganbacteria bacterium]|nr:biotin--[acetyl-CoA-carboxylase] ligase [Candidatus Saganbacteria bacterium]